MGICLNVGCGLDAPQGWINIDISPSLRISKIPLLGNLFARLLKFPKWPPSVRYGDLMTEIQGIKPDGCDLIFASHVLEHLALPDFHTALNHVYSYLKPGGIFRLIVPDLQKLASAYLRDAQDETNKARAATSFMTNSGLGQNEKRNTLYHRIRQAFGNSNHQWMWDFESLSFVLKEHGFVQIHNCGYGDWGDNRFKAVEKKERHINSTCLEAIKPS